MALSNGPCHVNTVYTNMTYKDGKIPTQDEIDKGLKEINRRKKLYERGRQSHTESDRDFRERQHKYREDETRERKAREEREKEAKLKLLNERVKESKKKWLIYKEENKEFEEMMEEYRESKCQISLEQGKAVGCILMEPTKIKIFDRMNPLL